MTEKIKHKGKARMVNEPLELNKEGCLFFCESKNHNYTLITSSKLRWLTFKDIDGKASDKQVEANEKIQMGAGHPTDSGMKGLKVLLYEDPKGKKKDVEHIKTLLKCKGVDIRYKKEDHRWRLAMNNNKIFLSSAPDIDSDKCTVNQGWVYETTEANDLLVEYFKAEFNKDFDAAKRLKLKGGKIVDYDSRWKPTWNWIKLYILSQIPGAILGAIIALILN